MCPHTGLSLIGICVPSDCKQYFRSLKFGLQLYSPSLKVNEDGRDRMAVFTDRDQVAGKVTLNPNCYPAGRLTISVGLTFSLMSFRFVDLISVD